MTASGRSRSDFLVIAALARGGTHAEAATEGRVSESTVRRRLRDPEFRARLGVVRDDVMSRTIGMLVDASTEAVEVLRSVMADDDATDPARTRAAVAILGLGPRLRENVELAGRIAALEEFLAPGRLRGVP